jgi:diguanylate cyclase (GGDEF)-like protein/putative nucleotidyltransferase with HDIG domain
MDLDQFKALNDTHGHLVGDQVLRELALVVRQVARSTDVVARFGGDEYVVVLSQTEPSAGLALGNRILNAVANHTFCESTLRLRMTASIGVVHSRDINPTKPASEMLRLADQALYNAKREGRNRVRLWTSQLVELPPETGETGVPAAALAAPTRRGRILIVDDDAMIGKMLETLLTEEGYEVVAETVASSALALVRAQPGHFDVVITDLSMPDSSGLTVLDELQALDNLAMRIVLTGYATKDNAVASMRHGAFDFIEKPLSAEQLLAVLEKALDHRRLRVENERYRLHLEEMVRQKSAELLDALDRVTRVHNYTLQALAALLDAREHATGQHSTRVMELALILGRGMALSKKDQENLGHGALMHDIGKIAVPDSILLKAGPLTQDEWRIMKTHPEVGYNILRSNPDLEQVADIVYSHQEHFDGTGYPRALRGSAICMGARIFAVIDTYDALRSERPYRRAVGPDAAVAEIRRCSGSHFDPNVVEAFVRCQPEMEKIGGWPRV